jgi:mRNA-degrading endonuclease RelE of RelBE toxin-antitoxin system
MTIDRNKNKIDQQSIIKEKLKNYKKKRKAVGNKDNIFSNPSDVFDFIGNDDELMAQVNEISMDDDLRHQQINEVRRRELWRSYPDDYPNIDEVLDEVGSLSGYVEELKDGFDEHIVEQVEEITDDIMKSDFMMSAKEKYNLVKDTAIVGYLQSQSLGNVLTSVMELGKNIAMTTASGAACVNAYKKLDFHYWLEQKLLMRNLLIDQLDNIGRDDDKPPVELMDELEDEIWRSNLFKDIFDEKEWTVENIGKLPVDAYRTHLIKYFSVFSKEAKKLSPDERKFIKEHQDINENNIISIIAELERRHITQKLHTLENKINYRLIAQLKNDDMNVDLDKIQELLNTYLDQADLRKQNENEFSKTALAIMSNKDIDYDNDTIQEAIFEDEKIQDKLSEQADNKRNELIARILLLAAAVVTVAIAATVLASLLSVPGLGPVILGLGVAASALTIAAYIIKPDIFTSLKTGYQDSKDKIVKYFQLWDKKKSVKEEAKIIDDMIVHDSSMFKHDKKSHQMISNKSDKKPHK